MGNGCHLNAGMPGSGASTVTPSSIARMADSSVVKLSIAQLFRKPGFVRTVTDTISPKGSKSARKWSLAVLPPP